MAALADFLAGLDLDPVRRGRQFERICKWFLTHDPVYARQLRRVWLWNEWPGRWGIDAGIDLVAEDHDGRLWAIQAKAYDAAYRITKRAHGGADAGGSDPVQRHRHAAGTNDSLGRGYSAAPITDWFNPSTAHQYLCS